MEDIHSTAGDSKAEVSLPPESKAEVGFPPKESHAEGASPRKESQVFALVIGINEYRSSDYPILQGAVNDARAFEQYLLDPREKRGLGVPASNILVLKDQQATRASILAAFQSHFLDNPRIPDGGNATMILFYAGHGTRILAPENNIARDFKVEAISPVDERTKDATGNYVHAIPDYVLGWLLRELARKKGSNITVIFDACHSGGLGRDFGQERTGDSNSPSVPLELDSHLWKGEAGAEQTAQSFRMWSPSATSHVLLAACGQHETAREIKYKDDNSIHGRFTESLITWLRRLRLENTTYAELLNRLPTWSGQTPHCGGNRRRHLVFDGNYPATGQRALPLMTHTSPNKDILRSFRVDIGSVEGVVPETEFTVYDPDNNELCILVAHSVEIARTILVTKDNKPLVTEDGQAFTIPKQSRVVISDWKNDAMILHVYTPDGFPHTADLFPAHDILKQPNGRKYVQAISVQDADISMRREDAEIVIENLKSTILECQRETRFSLSSTAHLPKVVDGIAHFNYFLERHHGEAPLTGVSLEMHRLVGDYPGRTPDLTEGPAHDGNLVANRAVSITSIPGAKYGFTIRNTSMDDLFPYLFYFDPEEYTITLWYGPETAQVAAPLKAKTRQLDGTVTIGMGGEPGFSFPLPADQNFGAGFFKLFVATEYLEIDWIKQTVSPFDPDFEGTPRMRMIQEPMSKVATSVVLSSLLVDGYSRDPSWTNEDLHWKCKRATRPYSSAAAEIKAGLLRILTTEPGKPAITSFSNDHRGSPRAAALRLRHPSF
ncbi:caspase domain-containing protein [Mycena maculata]|uniref:Caspase domain-containing protein n=1 Tax=Mycena maculata TaxID=230809 RepID=A0AAD7I6M3_9AGAR|nr:caspase domain-containing protein [Mycena maculata]